jgi:hypothetical protein
MANSFITDGTPGPLTNINLDQSQDLLADAEEDSFSFFAANSKAYNERKRVREEVEDAEDSSFEYRSIYFYLPEDHRSIYFYLLSTVAFI